MTWLAAVGAGMAFVAAGVAPAAAISGGDEAVETYSFMASLQDADGHFCGGTLIDPQWIVTAKHCLVTGQVDGEHKDPTTIRVRIGSNDRTEGGEVRRGERIETTPGGEIEGQDVALLKLDAPVDAAPAQLPSTESAPGDAVRTLGWGFHQVDDSGVPAITPIMLRQLDSHLTGAEHCVGPDGSPMKPNELCFASLPPSDSEWRQSPRGGDSGGPLLTRDHGGWTVHGTVSRGTRGQNQVFGSVHEARNWIERTIHGG